MITLLIVAGFLVQLLMGRSSFGAPPYVHLHALLFFGWVFLFLTQVWLATKGSLSLHRRLGWLGLLWAMAMVVVGISTTALTVRRGMTPFFFQPGYFLVMNSLSIIAFATLTGAAIAKRRQTDWHRRLMLCGMALLTGPAWGRLLPLPLMIPWAGWGPFVAVMLIPLAGMIADKRRTGHVHPAWLWGIAVIVGAQLLMELVFRSQLGAELYQLATAGSPGAAQAPRQFPPLPPGFPPA